MYLQVNGTICYCTVTPRISIATQADADRILQLQQDAYQSEAAIYNDFSIPPLTQSLSSLQEDFGSYVFLKAVLDGIIIGSVKLSKSDHTCFIERLIVDSNFQNKGVGTMLILAGENRFSNIKRFELFTGSQSKKNLYLYEKHGYSAFKKEKLSENVDLIFLEKFL